MPTESRPRSLWSDLALAGIGILAAGVAVRATVRRRRYFDLRDKVVLLTGGSRGLGLEIARRLIDEGARVAICARHEVDLRAAADELQERAGAGGKAGAGGNVGGTAVAGGGAGDASRVFAGLCDVGKPGDVVRFVDQVRAALGPIDVLVNNAGVIAVGPAEVMTLADYRSAMDVNFYGPLHAIHVVAPDMRRRGGGRIVNVASFGGKIPSPHLAPYAAAKHALVGLSESLRAEYAKDDVLVTTVCPGLVRTGSPRNADFKGQNELEYAWFKQADNTPLVSVSTERLSAQIIDALEHGDAELISPLAASVQAKLHGIAPGISTELTALVARLLPRPGGIGTRRARGAESETPASRGGLMGATGARAERKNNELAR